MACGGVSFSEGFFPSRLSAEEESSRSYGEAEGFSLVPLLADDGHFSTR